MTTRVNRAKAAAANTSVPIKLVVGHGVLTAGGYSRVPAGCNLIFLGRPGHLLNSSTLTANPQMFDENYVRGALTRQIRRTTVRPIQLANWTSHFYAPGDIFPELEMMLYDLDSHGRLPGTQIDILSGIHNLHRGQVFRKGKTIKSLRGMMLSEGPGIYIIVACRSSSERATSRIGTLPSLAHANYAFGSSRRMTAVDPLVNRVAQMMENRQRRYAIFKRSASSPSSPPSAKRRRPEFQFASGARNTGRRTTSGHRIFRGPMGGMYTLTNSGQRRLIFEGPLGGLYTLTNSGQRRSVNVVQPPSTQRRSHRTRAR